MVSFLAMSPDGTFLASGSDDGTVGLTTLESLFSLSHLPIQQVLKHLTWVEETLQRKDVTPNQQSWLKFILALGNRYRSFDIEVEEMPEVMEAGEFDIEIEEIEG